MGVETPQGTVKTQKVVLASGSWSKALGQEARLSLGIFPCAGDEAGSSLPMVTSEHSYIVTDIIPALGSMPNIRVPEDSVYLKVTPLTEHWTSSQTSGTKRDSLPGSIRGEPPVVGAAA